MRPRFQADADFNQKIVAGLLRREPSIDLQSSRQAELDSLPDMEVLKVAAAADRILLSHDRNTMPAYFAEFVRSANSPGLIIVPQYLDIGLAVEDLLLVWTATEATEWRARIGYLPI